MEIPMLDEAEFSVISELYSQGMRATKEYRKKHGLPINECSIEERFRPVRDEYARITGMKETNHLAIMHHRISIYGPPCDHCGKPLRTREASFCAACGKVPEAHPVR